MTKEVPTTAFVIESFDPDFLSDYDVDSEEDACLTPCTEVPPYRDSTANVMRKPLTVEVHSLSMGFCSRQRQHVKR